MSTNLPGPRSHGAPQDTEMDVAWQDLMAITELQFDGPGEGFYETTQYQRLEPLASMGGYGLTQSHTEPPPAAGEVGAAQTYDGCYSAELPGCHPPGSGEGAFYGHFGSQLNQRTPVSPQTQPLLMAQSEQMSVSGTSHAAAAGGLQGLSGRMLWATHAQSLPARSVDDLESDSGLSLGSSPSLASPDNPAGGASGYQSIDVGLTYSDGEPDTVTEYSQRPNLFSMDYQTQPLPYLHFSSKATLCQIQPDVQNLWSANQQSETSALSNMYFDSGVSSRGRSQPNMPAPASLNRDERRAMALKIPFHIDEMINLPVDDFNELLTQYSLTDTQLALVRDIRRRGKNKVAAQNCRKRKLESIIHLERDLNQLQARREVLARERLEFKHSLAFMNSRLTELYSQVFSHLRDEDGQPYSVDEYCLQQSPDGNIYLVPQTILQTRE